ncbi:MAG: hypothetical protein M3463_19045 [Verrucomicrobiota bacterium]|nr:hypothetical protein [Verrucomicrobiota bacterium]
MTKSSFFLFALAAAFGVSACDRDTTVSTSPGPAETAPPVARTKTLETGKLAATINAFERAPTAENSAEAKKAFADLESEIAELGVDVAKSSGGPREEAAAKLRNLETYRDAEKLRFAKAQAVAGVSDLADRPAETPPEGNTVGDSARRAGETIEEAAKKAGSVIKEGADKVGEAVKEATR